jgi:L-ascorbate metabolism protein UlaG (beta-lactamase superfamily)
MQRKKAAIEWVNHASFIFDYNGVRLICDPWLSGPAFNYGWRLLSPGTFTHADFAGVSHVWFSHQHPDHFSPRDIRAIPQDIRARLTVLYQETRDKKIVRFCQGLRFARTLELADGKWTAIAPDIRVMCGKWDDRDSWLAIRTPELTVLNVNDCFIQTADQARSIARRVGHVDVLMTQFSYANWAGNPDDAERRKMEAALKLHEIRLQVEAIKPSIVIPFASFVWFSHEENFYHNAQMNRVGDVAEFIERELGCGAAVLYPGQRWTIGERIDWRSAAHLYADDFQEMLERGPVDRVKSVAPERLAQASVDFVARIKQRNPALAFVPGMRTSAYVSDLDRTYEFTLSGMRELEGDSPADVRVSSDSLHFALRAPWGGNALAVNGRFSVPQGGDMERFFRFFRAADLNDHGYSFDFRWAANQVAKSIARRVRRVRPPAPV